LNEKRAAVGYAPLEEPPPEPATESNALVVSQKYRPDQARAPSGTSDGGHPAEGIEQDQRILAYLRRRFVVLKKLGPTRYEPIDRAGLKEATER